MHYLSSGTHVAEAILALAKSEEKLQQVHRDNTLKARQIPFKLYDVHGTTFKSRLTIAAKSFPRCKPWHTKLRAGFYDTEFEVESEVSRFESVRKTMTVYHCIA